MTALTETSQTTPASQSDVYYDPLRAHQVEALALAGHRGRVHLMPGRPQHPRDALVAPSAMAPTVH